MVKGRIETLEQWLASHRAVAWDVLRAYLGVALFVRGILFVSHPGLLAAYMSRTGPWFWQMAISHYVGIAHLGGGILLTVGFVTRWAALAQIPALLGAVFLVHLREGLMAAGQSLELSTLVLALLILFAVFGAGKYSVDRRLFPEVEAGGETQHDDAGHPMGPSPATGH